MLKSKTIRSWARAYGEELEVGQRYTSQPPTITIAFTNGAIEPIEKNENAATDKIHRLCMIMDYEDHTLFTDAMELHFINMRAFTDAVNRADSISINETEEALFAKWLTLITQKEINNKTIIEDACDEEDILMAVTTLQRQSEDKIIRQAYARRQDEIYFYNMNMKKLEQQTEENKKQAEEIEKQAGEIEKQTEEIEKLRKQIADLQAKQSDI